LNPNLSLRRSIATFISVAAHPLLLPSYLFYVVCCQLPGAVQYPASSDWWQLTGVVVLFTLVLPATGTALLLWLGIVRGSLELREREQRPLPLLLATLSFGAAALLLNSAPRVFDALLRHMMSGMTLAVLVTWLISLRWKISAHAVGVGGAVSLLFLLYSGNTTSSAAIWWLLGSILLAGAVLIARLVLDAHTPAQVWAGFALGIVLVLGFGASLALL
jgi:membrane-associated phospholipid phosphatase